MANEIERKFLVQSDVDIDELGIPIKVIQGYLSSVPARTVRVRIKGSCGFLTIKGPSNTSGTTRYEFEKKILASEAEDLLKICEPGIIEKTRTNVPVGDHIYEVDRFYGHNIGLVLAEVELQFEDEPFVKPSWLGKEVTGDLRYYNSALKNNPFTKW